MPAADTARLIASLELQDKNFTANTNKVLGGLDKMDQRFAKSTSFWRQSVSTAFGVGLERAVRAGIRGVFGALQGGLNALQEQGVVIAQTNAAIKSTGGVAHVSAGQVRELSEAIEEKTTIDDKQIQTAANLLLTFTNVRNEVGKGNDVFNQSVGILADMSIALGTDASSGAIQLGKALNDPVRGLTALRRVGVAFDADQERRIKQFVKEGQVIEAQKIILAELNKEFGGSGAAFSETDAGKAAKFADAIEDIQKAFATALLPAITKVRGAITGFLSDPNTVGQAERLGEAFASIFSEGNIKTAASLMTTAAGAVGQAISLFSKLPPEIQALAVGAVALKKITGIGPIDIFKGVTGELFKRGGTPASPLFVSDVTKGLGAGVTGKAAGALGALSKVFLVGEAIGLALLVNEVRNGIADGNTKIAEGLVTQTKEWLAKQPSKADLKNGLVAVENGLLEIARTDPQGLVSGQSLEELRTIHGLIQDQLNRDNSPDARQDRSDAARALKFMANASKDDNVLLRGVNSTLTALQAQSHADLQAAVAVLESATDPTAVSAAVAQAVASVLAGAGSGKSTGSLVGDLKTQLAAAEASGNKTLAQQIRDAIKQVEPFAKGRQWQQEQLQKAQKVVDSNKSTADKVIALKGIQQDLLSHQRTMAAGIVSGLLDVVNAVKNIKLSVTGAVNNQQGGGSVPRNQRPGAPRPGTPKVNDSVGFVLNANVTTSTRDVNTAQTIRSRMGPTPTEAGAA